MLNSSLGRSITSAFFQTRKNSASKRNASRRSRLEPKTYFYYGHGEEMPLKNNVRVPSGCTLSTISEAGVEVYLVSSIQLGNLAREHKEKLNNPLEHKEELKQLTRGIGMDYDEEVRKHLETGVYHLKKSGDGFKDKYCDFINVVELPNEITLRRSGLFEMNTTVNLPTIGEDETITIDKDGTLTMKQIEKLYDGSLYPTIVNIKKNIPRQYKERVPYDVFVEAVATSVKHTVLQIMNAFKGNHYCFTCRYHHGLTVDEANVLSAERAASRNQGNENSILLRKHNFERIIHKIRNTLLKSKDKMNKGNLSEVKSIIEAFNTIGADRKHLFIDGVNAAITILNDGFARRKITIYQMDLDLLQLILTSNKLGTEPLRLV